MIWENPTHFWSGWRMPCNSLVKWHKEYHSKQIALTFLPITHISYLDFSMTSPSLRHVLKSICFWFSKLTWVVFLLLGRVQHPDEKLPLPCFCFLLWRINLAGASFPGPKPNIFSLSAGLKTQFKYFRSFLLSLYLFWRYYSLKRIQCF